MIPMSSMMIIASGTVARIDRKWASVPAIPRDFKYTRSPGEPLLGLTLCAIRSAHTSDLEWKDRPVGFDDRYLLTKAHRRPVEVQHPVEAAVAAHRPI